MIKLDWLRKSFAIFLGFLTYFTYEMFLSNIPVPRVRSRPHIPAGAFSPRCTLVICQVEKGHRKIRRKNSRACRDGRKKFK